MKIPAEGRETRHQNYAASDREPDCKIFRCAVRRVEIKIEINCFRRVIVWGRFTCCYYWRWRLILSLQTSAQIAIALLIPNESMPAWHITIFILRILAKRCPTWVTCSTAFTRTPFLEFKVTGKASTTKLESGNSPIIADVWSAWVFRVNPLYSVWNNLIVRGDATQVAL